MENPENPESARERELHRRGFEQWMRDPPIAGMTESELRQMIGYEVRRTLHECGLAPAPEGARPRVRRFAHGHPGNAA
jgi:hypothetical protein